MQMQDEFGWSTLARVVVHDKASYFVSPQNARLQADFALGLRAAKLCSWLGHHEADTNWLAARLGDFYPHETLISHIRRLLTHQFLHHGTSESPSQFRRRLDRVEDYFNSGKWSDDHDALHRLAKSYRGRAEEVKARMGDRIPK